MCNSLFSLCNRCIHVGTNDLKAVWFSHAIFFILGLFGQANFELKLNNKNISTQESKRQLEIISSGP